MRYQANTLTRYTVTPSPNQTARNTAAKLIAARCQQCLIAQDVNNCQGHTTAWQRSPRRVNQRANTTARNGRACKVPTSAGGDAMNLQHANR